MDKDKDYSLNVLKKCSYRFLQITAKLLNLPCNVKKSHLINLIYTKKHKSPLELELLIKEVKLERLQNRHMVTYKNSPPPNKWQNYKDILKDIEYILKDIEYILKDIEDIFKDIEDILKKVQVQNQEIPINEKTNQSPSISYTPKRPGQIVVVCNPDINYYQNTINTTALKTYPPSTQNPNCDRVLRSSSMRNKRTSNSLMELLKSPVKHTRVKDTFNTTNEKKNKTFTSVIEGRRQYAKTVAEIKMTHHKSLLDKSTITKRQRTVSGIIPLEEPIKQTEKLSNYKYVHRLTIRSPDGTYSTIKALVQKPVRYPIRLNKTTQLGLPPLTLIDSIDKNNNQNCTNSEKYPNLSSGVNNDKYVHVSKVHSKWENIQYYRKKNRTESVNNLRFNKGHGNNNKIIPKGGVSLLHPNACTAITESRINDNGIMFKHNKSATRNVGPHRDSKNVNTNNESNKENGYISENSVYPRDNESIPINHDYARNNGIVTIDNEYPRCNADVPVNHHNAKNSRIITRNDIISSNDELLRHNATTPTSNWNSTNVGITSKINGEYPSYDEFSINHNNDRNFGKNPRTSGSFSSNDEFTTHNSSICMYHEYAWNSETSPRINSVITSNDEFTKKDNNVMARGNARNSGSIPETNSITHSNYELPENRGSIPMNHEHARNNGNIPMHKEFLPRNHENMPLYYGYYERIRGGREYGRLQDIIPIINEDPKTNGNICMNYATNNSRIPNNNEFPSNYGIMPVDHEYSRKYGVTPSNNVCTPINRDMTMINSISSINEFPRSCFSDYQYHRNFKYYPLNNGYSRNQYTRNSAYPSRKYPRIEEYSRRTEGLPRISAVFSRFNDYYHANDPLYMNFNENNTPPTMPHFALMPQNKQLEVFYNYRKQCIIDDPVLYPVTVSAFTETIYSRSMVMSACVQASAYENTGNFYRPPQHSPTTTLIEPERYESTPMSIEDDGSSPDNLVPESCDNTPMAPTPAEYYEVNDNTIPDMVEDAMEIISQDGDYLERCGIDVRLQCILCSWAGAKITLEHHIRRTHSAVIYSHALDACSATYSLRTVPRAPRINSRVLDIRGALIALNVNIEPPDTFRASFAMITHETEAKSASITVFNKLTGEPYTWHGVVQQLTENFPFDIESCLEIDLRKTNQLPPNSNMDEINKQLDINSPTQVVIGSPDLVTDISITLFIKIH